MTVGNNDVSVRNIRNGYMCVGCKPGLEEESQQLSYNSEQDAR